MPHAPLEEILARHSSDTPPATSAGAAVLIVARDGAQETEVLLIERAVRREDPASGHIALPGGRVERSDPDLRATAIRELEEEVGLTEADLVPPIRYIGIAEARWFRTTVGIFAARLGPSAGRPRRGSEHEVADVFWLPSTALDATQRVPRNTFTGEVEVDATVFEGHVLWGFTRRVLREFFLGEETVRTGAAGSPTGRAPPG